MKSNATCRPEVEVKSSAMNAIKSVRGSLAVRDARSGGAINALEMKATEYRLLCCMRSWK